MSYNGWKNYETWCVNLWLTNDETLDGEARTLAAQYVDDEGAGRSRLADALKEYVDDLAEGTCPGCREGASFVADLLGAALSEVDWYELADNLLSEYVSQ